MPLSSFNWSRMVPSCRHGPVPFAVVRLLLVWWRVPGTNFRMSLQIWPVVELSQTKKTESVSKWIWVFSFSVSPSANEDVKPWRRSEVYDAVSSPSEDNEMQSATPSEGKMKVLSPSEGSINLESKMWKHLIPTRIPSIPIMVNITKKEEIIPFGGVFGHAFWRILIPDNSFEASLGVQVTVLDFVSAITPS